MPPNPDRAGRARIALLGPTLISAPGARGPLRESAARTLIAVLAATGRPIPAETLAVALWPTRPPASPVAAVRTVAWRARKLLGAETISTDAQGAYRLELDRCDVDIERFRDRLTKARDLQRVDRPDEALSTLDEALALWRGSVLAEWSTARWAVPVVAELTELHAGAREEHAALCLAVDDVGRAESELRALCRELPDREHAWALLVTALGRAGRPREARRAYDQARAHLAGQGLEPGAELRVALEQVGRPGRADGIARIAPGEQGLVGRDQSLKAVRAAIVDCVETGRSKLLLIEGEAGVGKTLLARTVVADLQTQHRALAWFSGCDQHRNLPYAPLVGLLRAQRPTGTGVGSGTGTGSGSGSAAIDWLSSGELSHWQVREQFAALATRAAGRVEAEVLVLVVDDVQWAPDLTLDVLAHLLGRPADVPVVVLATARTHGDTGAADSALDTMRRRVWTETFPLAGLDHDESVELYRRAGGELTGADHVWRLTGGNPFYLLELARAAPAALRWGGVAPPAMLERALAARVDELPAVVRPVLTLAATIGAGFDELVLSAAAADAARAGLPIEPTEVVDALLAGVRTGLVVPVEGESRQWQFRHDLIRQSLYFRAGGPERAQLHLCVARALQRVADQEPSSVEQVARHLRAAWPLCPGRESAEQLLRAAETPIALLDPRVAAHLAGEGLDVLALEPDADPQLRARLLVARGAARADAADIEPARADLRAGIELLRDTDPDRLAAAVAGYADTWRDRAAPPHLVELLDQVAGDSRLGLSPARCAAIGLLQAVRGERAAAQVARLATEAEADGDVEGARRLYIATWRWEDAHSRQHTAEALLRLGVDHRSGPIIADAVVRQAITSAQLGEALVLPARPGAGAPAMNALWAIAVHLAAGAFELARDGIHRAARDIVRLAEAAHARPAHIATLLLRQCIQLATFTGRAADADLLAAYVKLSEIPVDLESGAISTLIRCRRGDVAGARARCAATVEQPDPVLITDRVAEYGSLVLACIETGYPRGLPHAVARLMPFADQHIVRGEHLYLGPVRQRLGDWAAAEGRFEQAHAYYATAAAQAAAIGAVPAQVRALLAQAKVAGSPSAARALTDQAETLAASIGMVARRLVGEILPSSQMGTWPGPGASAP